VSRPRCEATVRFVAGEYGEHVVICGQTVGVSRVVAPDGSLHHACQKEGHRGQVERRLARTHGRVVA
jgi:hypothetical protein